MSQKKWTRTVSHQKYCNFQLKYSVMSYDLYCYKSKLGKPDEEEADSVIQADNDKWAKKEKDPATKLAIVQALIACNSRLEAVDFEYGEIAKLSVKTIGEAGNKFNRIEINPKAEDLAIQISVYDNHVFLSVPYLYKGQEAKQVFDYLKTYIKAIKQTAGYFVCDPQTGEVFDPAEQEFNGLDKYLFTGQLYSDQSE
jgi:hypothetical protein